MQEEVQNISDIYILLVESSKTQAKIIAKQLQELNVSLVDVAHSGEQAMEMMAHNIPDLVISSLYLSDQTGTELVKQIRASEQLKDIHFMLVSSETSFEMLDPIRQAGVVAILPKPFTTKDLKTALNTTLDFINVDEELGEDVELAELEVLLVDDSGMARKHIRRVLTNLGMERIDEAVNGKDAVGKIENKYYDLIVTDYNMPEMDGQELTKYIREQSSQSSVPVLMVTSEEDDNRLAAVQQAGVSGICDKPFEPETVKNYLKKILVV